MSLPEWETITEETTTHFQSAVGWWQLVVLIAMGVATGIVLAAALILAVDAVL